MNVLFVFAHQDDEIAAGTRILRAVRNGDHVVCVFLTDGALNVPAARRNEESRRALARLGVTDLRFAMFPDGNLPEHVGEALSFLESIEDVDEVCTLAWEGGHQDHDAAHIAALAFAGRRGVPCREVPLYHGGGKSPRGIFRVMRPVGEGWTKSRIRLSDGLLVLSLVRFYRSQRKTWAGLLPEAMFELLLARRAHVRDSDPHRLAERPQKGLLFYERRFGYPYERFARATRALIEEMLILPPTHVGL